MVGLDGAEGEVLGRDAHLGEDVEERGLAHVGEADDADLGRGGGGGGGRSGETRRERKEKERVSEMRVAPAGRQSSRSDSVGLPLISVFLQVHALPFALLLFATRGVTQATQPYLEVALEAADDGLLGRGLGLFLRRHFLFEVLEIGDDDGSFFLVRLGVLATWLLIPTSLIRGTDEKRGRTLCEKREGQESEKEEARELCAGETARARSIA